MRSVSLTSRGVIACGRISGAGSTVAVLRFVMSVLRWGFVWRTVPVTLSDWFRPGGGVTPVKSGAAVPCCLMRDHKQ